MSSLECPYCEIKEIAKIKTTFQAIKPRNGKCPDCGAYIDAGQHEVDINGYVDIYKGAIELIDYIVTEIKDMLTYHGIDLNNDLEEEVEEIQVSLRTSIIMDRLFATYYGSTTKGNLAKALGITEDQHTWTIACNREEMADE